MSTLTEHMEARLQLVQALQKDVREVDPKSDAAFAEILNRTLQTLEIPEHAAADALLVSRPTLNRWARGKNLPHIALRQPVLRWVEKQIAQKVRFLQQQQQRSSRPAGPRDNAFTRDELTARVPLAAFGAWNK